MAQDTQNNTYENEQSFAREQGKHHVLLCAIAVQIYEGRKEMTTTTMAQGDLHRRGYQYMEALQSEVAINSIVSRDDLTKYTVFHCGQPSRVLLLLRTMLLLTFVRFFHSRLDRRTSPPSHTRAASRPRLNQPCDVAAFRFSFQTPESGESPKELKKQA